MRLVEIGALPDDSDLSLWEASCDTVSHQIALKLARKEGGLMEIFNAVVASLPRKSDVFRFSAISAKPSMEKAHESLVENLAKIIPILVENGWKKSPDFQKNSLIDSFSLLAEREETEGLFRKAQETRTITEDDVDEYFVEFDKKFERLLNYGKPQFELADTDSPQRPKYANLCIEVLVAIGVAVKNAQKISNFLENQNMKASKIWMTRIPEVCEKVTNAYDYPTMFDIAMALEGFPLRKVFLARRIALQSMIEVFVETAPTTKYKVRERARQELEKATRFVGNTAELGHSETLISFSPKLITTSIEDSQRRLEVETIERLRRCGYLENLGAPLDELVRAQIASIREILPHFSAEIVHLALRHFSYDSEVTLASLLSRENLPIELLRLENVELKSGVGSGEWLPLDFTASDEIEKSIQAEKKKKDEELRRDNEKKASMNLFSLARILSDRPSSPPVDQQAELRARALAYRTSVLTKLHKLRAVDTPSTEKIAVDAENLVPMATSKKYSALNSLKISEADKVAIRPTYDKYRYETADSDVETCGVYNDEYDDEYDRREFNVERLKLKKVADVEVDDQQRIICYKQKDGGLELSAKYNLLVEQGEGRDREIIQFLADKSKRTDKPFAGKVLLREFKEKTGCTDSISGLEHRYQRVKSIIYQSSGIDENTKIKMMFLSHAKLPDDVLEEIRKNADVKVDEEGRITKYRANDGNLELKGSHERSSILKSVDSYCYQKSNENESEENDDEDPNCQKDYEKTQTDLVRFLIERTKNATTPLSISNLAKDYLTEFKGSDNFKCTEKRIRSFRQRIHKMKQFDILTKVKLAFALSASIDADFLKKLQQDAIVELDEKQRIKKYNANDLSLNLEGDHSVSAKMRLVIAGRKKKKDRVFNNSSHSENSESIIAQSRAAVPKGRKRARKVSEKDDHASLKVEEDWSMDFDSNHADEFDYDPSKYELEMEHIPEERKPESLIEVKTEVPEESSTNIVGNHYEENFFEYDLLNDVDDMEHIPEEKKPESLLEVKLELPEAPSTSMVEYHYEEDMEQILIEPKQETI